MSKKRFILDEFKAIGIDNDGYYSLIFFTNYGKLTYDTKFKKFELNDIEISSKDYEFDNIYMEIFRLIDLFISNTCKTWFSK